MRNPTALLLTALLLTACKVGPDYEAFSFTLPESWVGEDAPAADATPLPTDWWQLFNDPALTALVEEGLKHNADIALAAARVSEARATLRLNDANLYPNLSAQGGATRTSRSEESTFGGLGRSSSKPYNDFNLSAVLSYEVDLWGKLRRASEGARASLLSEKANRDAVRLAVVSDIATGYFALMAFTKQVAITNDTIATRKDALDYQTKQYNAGAVDVLTLRRAEAELAAAEATLPVLEQARTEQQHALAILLGRTPKEIIEATVNTATDIAELPVPPTLPATAPSTLLERRPDVSAAEQTLIASNAAIGVAKADYFPTLSLSALIGLASTDIDRLLRSSARTWNGGAATAMPLLDFGRTSANVDVATARKEQAFITYQHVVRGAFGEVADALSRVRTSAERTTAQARQVDAYRETVRVAKLRYDAGYATQLDRLDAERQLFTSQLDQVSAKQAQLAATVTLYKALGGGWNTTIKAADMPEAKAENPEIAAPEKQTPARAGSDGTTSDTIPADAPFKRQRR